jgi:hypothetical protein
MPRDSSGPESEDQGYMFVFFSNRLGCAGSVAVSVAGTILLILLIRSCSGYSTW